MADSRRDDSIESPAGTPAGRGPQAAPGLPGESSRAAPAVAGTCPDCGSLELTLIRDAEIVSFYKCPRCGHLAAPVKRG